MPEHLEEYVSNVTPEDMSKLLTILLDIAVQHRMFEYPSLGIERDVASISQTLQSLSTRLALNTSTLNMYFAAITDKLDKLLEHPSQVTNVIEDVPTQNYSIDFSKIETQETLTLEETLDEIDDSDIIF